MATVNVENLLKQIKGKQNALKAGSFDSIKPKEGDNRMVLLGAWEDGGPFWQDFAQHFIKDAPNGKPIAVYVCNSETFGEPCAVCQGLSELQRTVGASNPAVAELLKEARGGKQFLVNVLALDSDKPDEPQVLQLSKTAFDQLLTALGDWAEQVFDPTSPQIINIHRSGTTAKDTRYTVQVTPKKHVFKKPVKPINLAKYVDQRNEEGEKKALNALRLVSGVRPNGALSNARTNVAALPAAKPAADEFEDVPDFSNKAAASKSGPAQTDDIDALLASLNEETGT